MKFFDKLRILAEENIIETIFISKNWDSGTYTYITDVLAPLHLAKLKAMLETRATTAENEREAYPRAGYQPRFLSKNPYASTITERSKNQCNKPKFRNLFPILKQKHFTG